MADSGTHPAPSQWYCDRCSKLITNPELSNVVWQSDENHRSHDFLVVHKESCDPLTFGNQDYASDMEVGAFLGHQGMSYLLSMLSNGPLALARGDSSGGRVADLDQFVELFRRMQIPHYEEARRHFRCEPIREQYSDANEGLPYEPDHLQRIANHEGECRLRA